MSDSDYIQQGFDEMAQSDLLGGMLTYNDTDGNAVQVPCNTGIFSVKSELVGNGWASRVTGTVTVAKRDAASARFTSGSSVTVSDNNGDRVCTVDAVRDLGPLTQLDLVDDNDGI